MMTTAISVVGFSSVVYDEKNPLQKREEALRKVVDVFLNIDDIVFHRQAEVCLAETLDDPESPASLRLISYQGLTHQRSCCTVDWVPAVLDRFNEDQSPVCIEIRTSTLHG